MNTLILTVPDVLRAAPEDAEEFYTLIEDASIANQYVLDLQAVRFVNPYGLISLVSAARLLSARSSRPIKLINLSERVFQYLDRMDLFQLGTDWLSPSDAPVEKWARNPHTLNLLELTLISGPEDIQSVALRAQRIFERWLQVHDLRSLINVLSELCANIYQHSQDEYGGALIQKYEQHWIDSTVVNVAVGDLGCGIQGSLVKRFGEIGREPLEYLREALAGRTARPNGRGGLGLRRVEQIAAAEGGYLWLRSDTAAILSQGPGDVRAYQGLAYIPGTQVAVQLRASLT